MCLGYFQVICKKGHYTTSDIYDLPNFTGEKDSLSEQELGHSLFNDDPWTCPICASHAAWSNFVDKTRGEWEDGGRIDGYVEIKRYKICDVLDVTKKIVSKLFDITIFYVDKYKVPENFGVRY